MDIEEARYVWSKPRRRAVEWVLQQRGGDPMRPVEIWAELRRLDRDDPKDVAVATERGIDGVVWPCGRPKPA